MRRRTVHARKPIGEGLGVVGAALGEGLEEAITTYQQAVCELS